ncbi:YadA-like family protein [Salmonella enterica]|nr:YadA-like family protein [Salmonella enterica]
MENSDNSGSHTLQGCKAARLQGCKARSLKSTNFTFSSLVLALFLSSNMAYAEGFQSEDNGNYSVATGSGAEANGNYSVATGSDAQANGRYSVAIGDGAQSDGTDSVAIGDGAQSDAKATDSTAIGSFAHTTGTNSLALGAYSVASHDNEVNIGIWHGGIQTGRTLSGLADGVNPDEAVNKGQLDKAIAGVSGGVSKSDAQQMANDAKTEANKHTDTEIGSLDTKAQGYASTAQAKAKDYTDDTAQKTLKSANENTERRAVVAENNAVTRSKAYTDESSDRTLESANTYTNHRTAQVENNAVARSNNYTDNRFGELRKSLEHTEKRLNAGIAGVTALSSIPYSAGNKFSYGIGAGNYQNGNAVAAGVQFRVSPSTNVRLNISWDSSGNNATGVGIAGGW